MERAVQFSLSEANESRVFMPVRTSRAAITLALVGTLAGALIQVPYARSIGHRQLYEPYFFFLLFGASTFASLGCMIANIFGATLSRRVCWLYGLACGYLLPELTSAIVSKIDNLDIYYLFQNRLCGPLRLFAPPLGFTVGLLASLYQRGMTRKSARFVLRAILYVVPSTVIVLVGAGDRLSWRIDQSFEARANSLMIIFGITFIVSCIFSAIAGDWSQERAFPIEPL